VQYFQHVSRLGNLVRAYGFDLLIVLLGIAAVLQLVFREDAEGAPSTTLWFCVPAAALMALPLVARRRFPFAAAAAFWLIAVGVSFVDGRLVPFLFTIFVVGMTASFLLGSLRDARDSWMGLVIVLGGAAIVLYNLPTHSIGQLVFYPLLFGVCWLAGFALHERAEQAEAAEARATQAEREREVGARIAVAEERARIARELHDVVAHAVSVMVLQAGAVRHKLPVELAEDKDALRHVEQTGRSALGEMRRLLGAMRSEGDGVDLAPQPGVDGLDALFDEVGRAGLPVDLHLAGEQFALPRSIDLSAYRIVQEGLTNALKHAHASHAEVTLGYAPDELRIEVRDDGRGMSAGDGRGHGLVGVRERVKIYGGEMTASTAAEGGFVLSARLPIEGNGA
jgi:signal transduction histidine kinase